MSSPILAIPELTPTQTDKTTTINDAILALEAATQDQLPISLAGGSLTLTPTQFTRYAVFLVSGQTAPQTLTVPLSKRLFAVRNAGAFTVTVGGATGATVAVTAGSGSIIQCDATNCMVFGSGGVGPAGPTGATGPIASLIAGAGLTGGTITTSGQTITANWNGGTVSALGAGLTLSAGTLAATALSGTNTWTAAQRGSVVTLTDTATIATDLALGNNYTVTLGGNRTLANPTNVVAGQAGQILIKQDATGSRTLAYGTQWKFPSGSAPVLSTAANAVDILSYFVWDSTHIAVSVSQNFS